MVATPKMSLENSWKNWYACLIGNDPNSIFRQITIMIWDTSIFHIILAARQSQVKKNPKEPEINEALHSFIDGNYFESQGLVIRRITDKSCGLTGKKGVYSLTGLITDIESYKNELTRKSYLELKNMPYDYKEIQRRSEEYILTQPPGEAFFVPPELDWQSIEEAHCVFDRLASVPANNRNPNDQIDSKVFGRLLEQLSVCTEITTYVDKFIAHSSTPESRSLQNYTTIAITLRHIWDAHRIIYEVANFLSATLFGVDHMALAIENSKFINFLDKPLIEIGEMDLLRNSFEDYRKETEAWQSDGVEDIWRAIESK